MAEISAAPDGRHRLNLAGGETKKMEGRRESVKRSEEEEKNDNEGRGPTFLRKKMEEGRVWFGEIRGFSDDL